MIPYLRKREPYEQNAGKSGFLTRRWEREHEWFGKQLSNSPACYVILAGENTHSTDTAPRKGRISLQHPPLCGSDRECYSLQSFLFPWQETVFLNLVLSQNPYITALLHSRVLSYKSFKCLSFIISIKSSGVSLCS